MKKIVVIILSVFIVSTTFAAQTPKGLATDQRIKIVNYHPNQVYRVTGLHGYTTAIQLAPEEEILAVNIGDSSAWTVSVFGSTINLKPIADYANTNMNVMTSRGNYHFALSAPEIKYDQNNRLIYPKNKAAVFLLQFHYPNDKPLYQAKTKRKLRYTNMHYSAYGDSKITPATVFDDGRFTYLDFSKRKTLPAIFAVNAQGEEALVNYHLQEKYLVVEQIGKQFTLRQGKQTATLFNEA